MPKPDTDVLILGAGCAGLTLAALLSERLIDAMVVDPRESWDEEDRTWSFWHPRDPHESDPTGLIAPAAMHRWSRWRASHRGETAVRGSERLVYRNLSARRFYEAALSRCRAAPGTRFSRASATGAALRGDDGLWHVDTDRGRLSARRLIDTRPGPAQGFGQWFMGREVATDGAVFDPSTVGLMEFEAPREGGVDFVYVLPFARDRALIEATTFGPEPPASGRFAAWLDEAVETRLGGRAHDVLRSERGYIPMQAGPLPPALGPHAAHAGLAGGGARPSTGYAFTRIQAMALEQARRIEAGEPDLAVGLDGPATRFMDRVFLRVLSRAPQRGAGLFMRLFRHTPEDRMERFLSGSIAPADRLSVVLAMPPVPFIRAAVTP